MKRAVIVQYRLLHYRLALFDQLRDACRSRGVDLRVVHGQATSRELKKADTGTLDWAAVVRNRCIAVGPRDLIWQPFPREYAHPDLVVLMQESRLISNYPWLFGPRSSSCRVAYWGHGRNMQSDAPNGLRERWKRYLVGRVDWWFAYTDLTKEILLANNYASDRVTVLDNAIDNEGFRADLDSVGDDDTGPLRLRHAIREDDDVGIFCGSLYDDKRLDMLIDIGDKIYKSNAKWKLLVLGDGPSGDWVRSAAASRPWLSCVGVKKGKEKAVYFSIAKVVLNPGAAGLHVLDAFCAGVPFVTTKGAKHGPEICYVRHGVNGVVVDGGGAEVADAVIQLLSDRCLWKRMALAARLDADRYTLSNMVNRFADGISQAIRLPRIGRK